MDSALTSIKFNVAYIKLCTKTEGPYKRCCIWFQGCNINCRGCCNKNLQPLVPNHIVTLKELIDIVKEAKDEGYDVKGKMAQGASALEVIDGLIKLETQKEQPDPINTQVLDAWRKNMIFLNSLGK